MDPTFAVKFFGALFAIMNPITNLPIFLSITDGASLAVQRQVAVKVAIYTLIMGGICAVAGTQILKLFGINIEDFRVAGGLVVLMIALNMLHGEQSATHGGSEDEKATFPGADSVAFYPMTFPMIVGPGTITTLVLFAGQAKTVPNLAIFAGIFVGLVAVLFLVFYNAPLLARHLSGTARVIMSRLMGMILTAIAIEMILDGLKTLLPGLA
ncbi:MarC family protein [Chachezhania sediminis]|uniref:MarC family protein n=1 Tax=Chachezhania sediminis TaxID=2599291 RepID=UPI00131CE156|nr:MarC family protein [Chachezhania sediminis]